MSATTDEATPIAVKPRLSRDFGKLWTAAAFSNLADGVGRTAVPLIATTLTRDPLAIAAIGALAFLPWPFFSGSSSACQPECSLTASTGDG